MSNEKEKSKLTELFGADAPWWATLITRVGAPMAIVAFVVYVTLSGLSANAETAAMASRQATELLHEHQKITEQFVYATQRGLFYSWVQCIRGSKNDADRALCGSNPLEPTNAR